MQIEEVDPTLKFERTPRQGAAISVFVAAVVALSTHASAQRTQKSTGAFAVPQTKFPGLGDARFLPSDVTKRRLEVPSDQAGKTRRQIGGPNGANVAEQVVDAYPTPARRPVNSKLNTTKIKNTFMLELPNWKEEVGAILKFAMINS